MAVSIQPVTLAPEQVAELHGKLAEFRHNLNNHLTLIMSAAELIKRKPEAALRMADTILTPSRKILDEIQVLSRELERGLGITREP